MATKHALLVGVGGQGAILVAKILVGGLLRAGYDVKMSEVHGMSQRGGSVVTYVKYGDKVYSPVIELGEADMIISFEQLEAGRWLPYLKKGGTVITNTQKIDPMPVITGNAEYPEGIIFDIESKGVKITALDALSLAEQAGTAKAVNLVLLGVCAKNTDIEKDVWTKAIETTVPEKFLQVNLKAFDLGYNHE